ncbi:hypothetical protein ACLI4Q_14865 [Natrialbaceae archaeon A-CW1-1]
MPKRESEQAPLSERVVKEAVGVGMDTPMREPILEAVKEAEGTSPPAKRAIPAVGLFGIGTAIGYLLGQSGVLESAGEDGDGTDLDITSAVESEAEEEPESMDEGEDGGEDEKSGGMAGRLLVLLGIAVGAVLVWRRRQAEGDEWEPIEEFEPAVDAVTMDEDEEEESEEAAEAHEDMEDEMDEEEAGGDDGEQDDGEEAEAES